MASFIGLDPKLFGPPTVTPEPDVRLLPEPFSIPELRLPPVVPPLLIPSPLAPSLAPPQENEGPTRITTVNDVTFQGWLRMRMPVIVEFVSEGCSHCDDIAPSYEKLAARANGRIGTLRIDLDDYPELAARYNVRGAPTFILINQLAEVARVEGAHNKELRELGRQAIELAR